MMRWQYSSMSVQIGVLFAFQGIYTTVVEDPRDRNSWLLAYFQAYGWGFAISLAVNILVWPVTSESELKDLIIRCVWHGLPNQWAFD